MSFKRGIKRERCLSRERNVFEYRERERVISFTRGRERK